MTEPAEPNGYTSVSSLQCPGCMDPFTPTGPKCARVFPKCGHLACSSCIAALPRVCRVCRALSDVTRAVKDLVLPSAVEGDGGEGSAPTDAAGGRSIGGKPVRSSDARPAKQARVSGMEEACEVLREDIAALNAVTEKSIPPVLAAIESSVSELAAKSAFVCGGLRDSHATVRKCLSDASAEFATAARSRCAAKVKALDSLLLEFELNACELDTLGRFFGCYMSLEARPAFPRLGVMSAPTLHGVSLYVDFARVTAAHVVQKTIHEMSTPVAKPESALQDLARLESVGASLRAMDVRVILKIIEHHFTHHAVLARASCVLGGLVWASIDNPSVFTRSLANDAILRVCAGMASQMGQIDVQRWGCYALWALTYISPEQSPNVQHRIQRAKQAYPAAADLHQYADIALSTIMRKVG